MKSATTLVVIGLLFSGCEKIQDYYDIEGTKKAPPCQLMSVTYTELDDQDYTITYHYDDKGKPESIVHPDFNIDFWSENFFYDEKDRLIRYTTYIYAGEDKVFAYEGDSRLPARDTAQDIWGRLWIERFEYDEKGRIVVVDRKWFSSPEGLDEAIGENPSDYNETIYYYYDVRGNRQYSPFNKRYYGDLLQYSDQLNVNSLNPVFQLLNRDYSKYSIAKDGLTFNQHGLPLTFQKSSVRHTYSCD